MSAHYPVGGDFMAEEHHGQVEVGGAQLHFRQGGQGPPVLFIHGGGCSSELWGECFDRVAVFARAVAYDQRSFARSSGEPGGGIARHGDDAAEVLDGLRARPATVLGHSFGATVALDLAVRYPDRVSAMVLLEPIIDFRAFPSLGMLGLTAGIQLRRLLRGERAAAHWFFRKVTTYRSSGTSAFEGLPAELQEVCLANAGPLISMFNYTPEASGRHLPKGGIGAIRCPVTCVIGTDSWPPSIRTTRAVAKAIPGARLIEVEGASHVLPYDASETVVEAVRALVGAARGAPAEPRPQQQGAGTAALPG
jgi:pimeloyl-ACP methyl ester carboxylesterase